MAVDRNALSLNTPPALAAPIGCLAVAGEKQGSSNAGGCCELTGRAIPTHTHQEPTSDPRPRVKVISSLLCFICSHLKLSCVLSENLTVGFQRYAVENPRHCREYRWCGPTNVVGLAGQIETDGFGGPSCCCCSWFIFVSHETRCMLRDGYGFQTWLSNQG